MLRARHIERPASRVDADHINASSGQLQREDTGAASDVQDLRGAERGNQVEVRLQVTAIGIEGVVDRGKARMLEVPVSHRPDLMRV